MKKSYKGFPIYALVILAVLIVAQLFSQSMTSRRGVTIEYSQLLTMIKEERVEQVALQGSTAYVLARGSSIPSSAFSTEAYDYDATVSRDTFVTT